MLECIFHYMWSGRGGDLHSEQQHWKQLSPCIIINASSYLWIFNILTVKSGKSCGSQGSWSWSQQTEGEGLVSGQFSGSYYSGQDWIEGGTGSERESRSGFSVFKKTIITKKWWNAGWVFAALLADSDDRNRRETSFQFKWCHYRLKSTSSQPVTLLSLLTSLEQHFQRISWQFWSGFAWFHTSQVQSAKFGLIYHLLY